MKKVKFFGYNSAQLLWAKVKALVEASTQNMITSVEITDDNYLSVNGTKSDKKLGAELIEL